MQCEKRFKYKKEGCNKSFLYEENLRRHESKWHLLNNTHAKMLVAIRSIVLSQQDQGIIKPAQKSYVP